MEKIPVKPFEKLRFSDEIENAIIQPFGFDLGVKILNNQQDNKCDMTRSYFARAVTDPSKISYIPANRMDRFEGENYYNNDLREKFGVMSKAGKVLKYLYPDATPQQCEKFTHQWTKDIDMKNFTFKIVEGSDILKYYSEDSYSHDGSGTLQASCMKYDNCQNWINLYPHIGIKMLCLIDNETDKLIGRALLWDKLKIKTIGSNSLPEDIVNSNLIFMDRIYFTNEPQKSLFINYAIENNYLYKDRQSYDWKETFRFNNELFKLNITREVLYHDDGFPYVDTFTYLSNARLIMSNMYISNCYELTSTEGDSVESQESMEYSSLYDEDISEDDAVFSDYHDTYIDRSRNSVHEANYSGATIYIDTDYTDDFIYIESESTYYEKEEVVYVENVGKCELIENCIYLDYLEEWYLSDDIGDIIFQDPYDNEYYLEEDMVKDLNGDMIYSENAKQLPDKTWIHEDDYDEEYETFIYVTKQPDLFEINKEIAV